MGSGQTQESRPSVQDRGLWNARMALLRLFLDPESLQAGLQGSGITLNPALLGGGTPTPPQEGLNPFLTSSVNAPLTVSGTPFNFNELLNTAGQGFFDDRSGAIGDRANILRNLPRRSDIFREA